MENFPNKIVLVLASPFPTQKAYGVTTRETLAALTKLRIQHKIYCLQSRYIDNDYSKILGSVCFLDNNIFAKFFMKFSKMKSAKIFFIMWYLSIFFSVLGSLKSIKKFKTDFFWIRDPILAIYLRFTFPKTKIILELHDYFSPIKLYLITIFKKNIFFFPTNEIIDSRLKKFSKSINSNLAPLGVNSSFIKDESYIDRYVKSLGESRSLNIGYVGRFSSGGKSKGIEDLISLAQEIQFKSDKYRVILTGATSEEKESLEAFKRKHGIDNSYLEIEKYIAHSNVSKKIQSLDVLVLPSSDNNKYQGIPLKLLEYLASGKIVVIGKTQIIDNFINDDFKPFYYESGNVDSLYRVIEEAIIDPNLKDKLMQSLSFSCKFTWEYRTKKIINNLESKYDTTSRDL